MWHARGRVGSKPASHLGADKFLDFGGPDIEGAATSALLALEEVRHSVRRDVYGLEGAPFLGRAGPPLEAVAVPGEGARGRLAQDLPPFVRRQVPGARGRLGVEIHGHPGTGPPAWGGARGGAAAPGLNPEARARADDPPVPALVTPPPLT